MGEANRKMNNRSVLVMCALAAALAAACGSSSSNNNPPPACPQDNPDCAAAATVDEGSKIVGEKNCAKCHTQNLSGSTVPLTTDSQGKPVAPDVKLYPPNLTGDPDTGLGKWTDDEIARAIRSGIDDQGLMLCPQMNHFATLNDYEAYSVVKYLRSIPAVKNQVPPSTCPPLK
jgi:mono/diheme cytochrome c family protein